MTDVPEKLAGHCTQCGTAVFEIEAWRDGIPLRVGAALEGAWRVNFVLTNGNQMYLTFCETCAEEIDLPKCWNRVLDSFRWEGANGAWFEDTCRHVPLMLNKRKWSDYAPA